MASVLWKSARLRIITGRTATSAGARRPEDGVRAPGCSPSEGYIVEGEHVLAEHAPLQEPSAGTVIVEARRHLLDFEEMTPAGSAELGSVLNRLVPATKAAAGVQRVCFLGLMERAPLPPLARAGEGRGRPRGRRLPGATAPSHHGKPGEPERYCSLLVSVA
jgi:hypothetical protein